MTLSSRDPHLGQRIVLNASITHNQLYRQCFRTRNLFNKLSDLITSMIFAFAPTHKRPIEIESGLKERLRQQNASVMWVWTCGFGSRRVFSLAPWPSPSARARLARVIPPLHPFALNNHD